MLRSMMTSLRDVFGLYFLVSPILLFFFLNDTPPPKISPLPLHAALPIPQEHQLLGARVLSRCAPADDFSARRRARRDHRLLERQLRHATESVHEHLVQRQRLGDRQHRSEEHTSELQSPCNLVCRLLLEKK